MSASLDAYANGFQSLERMQRLHRFYRRWGLSPFMALFFLAVMASLFLDRHRSSQTAIDAVFGRAIAICMAGSLYYFANLWRLRSWR